MKIIFDNEEQKNKFMELIGDRFDACPSKLGLKEFPMIAVNDYCTPKTAKNCRKCWEQSGIEMVVVNKCETNTKVELIPKEKWLAERIIDLLEVIKFDVEHSIIIPEERIDELDSIGILFNAYIKEMSKPSREEFKFKGMV